MCVHLCTHLHYNPPGKVPCETLVCIVSFPGLLCLYLIPRPSLPLPHSFVFFALYQLIPKPSLSLPHSQAFLVSTSFPGLPCLFLILKPSLSLPHSQAISLQYKSGEIKLSKAWDNILSPPFFISQKCPIQSHFAHCKDLRWERSGSYIEIYTSGLKL